MTIEDAIHTALRQIRLMFYRDRDREFHRDRNALLKAIARYGHTCHQRGWDLSPEDIAQDIYAVLITIDAASIRTYLPVYLEGAVDRHVRLRAEDIQAKARAFDGRVHRTVAGLAVNPERKLTAVETLDALYRQINANTRRVRVKRKQREQQTEFL